MGAYSFFARGMNLNHVLDIAKPEPAIRPPKASPLVVPLPLSSALTSTPASDPPPVPEAETMVKPEPERAEIMAGQILRNPSRVNETPSAAAELSDLTVPSPPPVPKPGALPPPSGLTTPRLFFCGEHTTIRDAQVSRSISTTCAIYHTSQTVHRAPSTKRQAPSGRPLYTNFPHLCLVHLSACTERA
jgi:hypothetical protein